MKRSEFAGIVNTVSDEEYKKLKESFEQVEDDDKNKIASIISNIANSIPAIAARTTAEILLRSGVISLEDD